MLMLKSPEDALNAQLHLHLHLLFKEVLLDNKLPELPSLLLELLLPNPLLELVLHYLLLELVLLLPNLLLLELLEE
jgi:hypothetical protein